MFFSRWFGGSRRSVQGHRYRAQSFRPTILVLEDRTVPSGFGPGFSPAAFFSHGSFDHDGHGAELLSASVAPGPATHLQVVVPENVQPGSSFKVLVEAEDASNQDATGYTGTVTLSLGTADGSATLPAAYTFTAADHGEHVFQVTLGTAGTQTINASGTGTTSAITGSATTTVSTSTTTNTPAVATQLHVVTQEQAAVGVASTVTVQVLDAAGHVVPNYTGTVTLSSSDTSATGSPSRNTAATALPITYTFTARDHGVHTFQVTYATGVAAGTATTVSASGTTADPNTTLSGQASLTVFPATTVTHFAIVPGTAATSGGHDHGGGCGHGRATVTAGTAAAFTVEALNAANQVVTGYTGTIGFASTDTAALVSATANGTATALAAFTYAFTAADNGSHTFYLTFNTTGRQTLTATDAALSSIVGSIGVRVKS